MITQEQAADGGELCVAVQLVYKVVPCSSDALSSPCRRRWEPVAVHGVKVTLEAITVPML